MALRGLLRHYELAHLLSNIEKLPLAHGTSRGSRHPGVRAWVRSDLLRGHLPLICTDLLRPNLATAGLSGCMSSGSRGPCLLAAHLSDVRLHSVAINRVRADATCMHANDVPTLAPATCLWEHRDRSSAWHLRLG